MILLDKVYNLMRDEFFSFVDSVKKTDIAEKLKKTSNATEVEEVWKVFENENSELFEKVEEWAIVYNEFQNPFPMIKEKEKIKNLFEVCIVIYMLNDPVVSEVELFPIELADEILRNENVSEFEIRVSELIIEKYLCSITAQDIFPDNIIYLYK